MNDTRIDYLLANRYTFSINNCINRGYELFQRQMTSVIGSFFLIVIIFVVLHRIHYFNYVRELLSAVLFAGYYYACHEVAEGRRFYFRTFFEVFKNRETTLTVVVNEFIRFAISLILFSPLLIIAEVKKDYSGDVSENLYVVLAMLVTFLIGIVGVVYLSLSWTLSVPLAVFRNRPIWTALEDSRKIVQPHWWSILGLYMIILLINLSGLICFFVGLFFTIPLSIFIIYACYEQIVGFEDPDPNDMEETLRHFIK